MEERLTTETSALAQPPPDGYTLVASPLHTISMLGILVVWAFLGMIVTNHLRAAANPHRIRFYIFSILLEWLWFILVVAGVRRRGMPLSAVLGDRWRSVREVVRDFNVAAGFWVVSSAILVIWGLLLRIGTVGRKLDFMVPHGRAEITIWIAVSISAGICEETIFRGYFQRQFIALTKSIPAGIFLTATAFGAIHAYQGYVRASLIGIYGLMFGFLAHWRRSVRPGMIAHAWQDSLAGVLSSLIRH